MTHAHVALIRGINVGGHNPLPMKVLSALFVEAGCTEVRTYIQSGNVVFRASPELAAKLSAQLGGAIAKQLGRALDCAVMIRSARELAGVIETNPYPGEAASDPKCVHVGFLEQAPTAAKKALLDPKRSLTDRFEVHGKELYWHTPEGLGRSKLTTAFFAKLGSPCTLRNWNTVLKLQSMLDA
ncbi:MAG: hypothetical protein JWN48_243 [Myxococcaceae bacterium]|nr:hypothetical protein [Myxococcaceae bacterium]